MAGLRSAMTTLSTVMRGLDPRICHLHALSTIVIPAKAGIQLHLRLPKLDPDFRRGDE